MRHLSPDEAALWRRVTGTVRRTGPRSLLAHARAEKSAVASTTDQGAVTTASPRPLRPSSIQSAKPAKASNTLDGSWDRKISNGRIVPDRTIDLHGHNLAGAHHRLERGLDEAMRDGVRVILLVTGRAPRAGTNRLDLPLRGIIRESVGDWLSASRHAGSIAAIRNAHPRHGGSGALYLILRRNR